MRLWHKDLIIALPQQQLLGQWRECCLIAKLIHDNGTPNHILVNKVLDYPMSHFCYYGRLVMIELVRRHYQVNSDKFDQWLRNSDGTVPYPYPTYDELFENWHNERYLVQCIFNLQEKYDCGGISDEEWQRIQRCRRWVRSI